VAEWPEEEFEHIEAVVGRFLDSGNNDLGGLETADHRVEAGRMGVEKGQGCHRRAGLVVEDTAVDRVHPSFVAKG
jgi:hypothetical protein